MIDDEDWQRHNLWPQPVACGRGSMTKRTYDAEVKWRKQQHVIGTGFATRDEALAAARVISDELEKMLVSCGQEYLAAWPEAKP